MILPRNKFKKPSVTKNSGDLKMSVFSLEFQKFFSITRAFFLTVGQNTFGKNIHDLSMTNQTLKHCFSADQKWAIFLKPIYFHND